ncbi:MAG: hypothetical protein PHD54_02335 [Desulfuromonadaceae bacterium]|nr:hypothetical protein [Desulfuromonadaceae bacterium]
MKRLIRTILAAASSRGVPPIVVGLFFLIYIGIAFFTDETLIALMALTGKSVILAVLLALIPLNSALRLLMETGRFLKKRKMFKEKATEAIPEQFDEMVELPASPHFAGLERRFAAVGYKTRRTENALAAWRGFTVFPARILFLAGTFCLFTGILISVTTRASHRQMVIEGEPMPTPEGIGGTVKRIALAKSNGLILARALTIEVAPSYSGEMDRIFGIYPPSLYRGSFVYPRYLGLDLLLQFSAPDLPGGYLKHIILNCYPPGKEDSKTISGSPYRIVFTIPEPEPSSDRYISYMARDKTLQFKLLKGEELLFSGSAPVGGEFARDGYRMAFPEARRLVVTDYIGDYGVFFIWATALFFFVAAVIWLPLRTFFPRKEMLFRYDDSGIMKAFSGSEGGRRAHAGIFHEALDLLGAGKIDTTDA